MEKVCVATNDSRAYYLITSRLRRARISFRSLVPGDADLGCDAILTTRREARMFKNGVIVMTVEDLDENPLVMKAQVIARVDGEGHELVIGVDPGSRIGLAAFYGGAGLGFQTFNSGASLYKSIAELVRRLPESHSIVRIGNGSPELAGRFASDIGRTLPGVTIEIVNEEGTSTRDVRSRGLPQHQSAAARIAFRKGVPYGGV
jgi:hypothetical protein